MGSVRLNGDTQKRCPLVFIEWEDSAQPVPNWSYLSDICETPAVTCVSVGWLVHNGTDVKALAPNMGHLNDERSMQVSGLIRIPARCIVNMVELAEPAVTSSASDLSARPVTEPTLQAS